MNSTMRNMRIWSPSCSADYIQTPSELTAGGDGGRDVQIVHRHDRPIREAFELKVLHWQNDI